jgi:hypothetical protein
MESCLWWVWLSRRLLLMGVIAAMVVVTLAGRIGEV